MVCSSSFVQALECDLTVSSVFVISVSYPPVLQVFFPEWSLMPPLYISLAFITLNYFFLQEKHHLYSWEWLGWTSEWGAFITLPLFSKPTLSLADISEVFCVKCEGRDSPLPPPPAPTSLASSSIHFLLHLLLAVPISDVRLCTDIHTQCKLWVLEVFRTDSPCNWRICQIQFSVNSLNNTSHIMCTVTHPVEV